MGAGLKNFILKIAIICLTLLLVACTNGGSFPVDEINPATDVCIVCKMQVTDNKFASEFIAKDGKSYKFDDIGCMMKYIAAFKEDISNIYVRDFIDSSWIDGKSATYLFDFSIQTPMSYGVISFSTKAKADEFIAEINKGITMSYTELLAFKWPLNLD